jgi:hypothetical protein
MRKAAPLEVIGDLVLEPGGGVLLPLGELFLQPIASDLAQRLHRRKGIDRIVSRIGTENPPPGRSPDGESDGLGGRRARTFLEGEEELVMVGGLGSWFLGKGNRILEEVGRRRRRPRRGNETAAQSAIRPLLYRFQTWMLPFFSFLYYPLIFLYSKKKKNLARSPAWGFHRTPI